MTEVAYDELREELRLLKQRVEALENALAEEPTSDDIKALEEADKEFRTGKTISHKEVLKKYL